jgi:hypothetical protein
MRLIALAALVLAQDAAPAKVDRAAVLKDLRDFSPAGISRRLGPDFASTPRGDRKDEFPVIWMSQVKEGAKGRRYEIGGPWTKEAGDYSSTQGQVLYASDSGPGVDRVTILEWSNGCFSERPEPPWWGGFRPDPSSKQWADGGVPVSMARGMGAWSNCGVILFSSGLIATAGTCTAKGTDPTFRLPKNKLPTAVAVTSKSEFALVTVVDTAEMKGQVAVLALESSGKKTGFPHEWNDDHAWCLPNVAVFTGIKLLGYVDLPGLMFPASISAAGDSTEIRFNGPDGNAGVLKQADLSQQSWRDGFFKGNNSRYASRSGIAVVASKAEDRVAFIDLQPLFQRVREMYFTTEENYRKTRNPKEWPVAFDVDPSWAPKLATVKEQPRPTAVLATLGAAHGVVACLDGTVNVFRAADFTIESTVQVGRNPVCLAYQKRSSNVFLVVSRGDREIAWVRSSGKDLQVIRRLRDKRLLDPVFVEVADTHGVETALLTVADFKGRKVVNYRFGDVVFATQGGARFGMGPAGKDEFECGGFLEFPGAPYCISAANVN